MPGCEYWIAVFSWTYHATQANPPDYIRPTWAVTYGVIILDVPGTYPVTPATLPYFAQGASGACRINGNYHQYYKFQWQYTAATKLKIMLVQLISPTIGLEGSSLRLAQHEGGQA
jgi:hypothetical protein